MRKVAGVPLVVRTIATAVRAGADSVVVVWPENAPSELIASVEYSPVLQKVKMTRVVLPLAFDPKNRVHWWTIASHLDGPLLWMPWNWVTHKRALAELESAAVLPVTWNRPALLEKRAVLDSARLRVSVGATPQGVAIRSAEDVLGAERLLVRTSGKVTDGIYSNFNRWLCRPAVRWLSRTPVTPNGLTLAGLVVAIVGAFFFARGTYAFAVIGALLFFISGLFDEMDGMMARIKFRESPFGTWFEGFVDNVTYLATFIGIIIGLQRQHGGWALKYGAALIGGSILSIAVVALQRKLATSSDRPHEYQGKMNHLMEVDTSNLISKVIRQIHIFIKKGVAIHYVVIFTVIGALPVFLWLAALGANLTWIFALYFTHRFFRRAPSFPVAGIAKAA
jgi:phosphatidylglycerophosphate synthase